MKTKVLPIPVPVRAPMRMARPSMASPVPPQATALPGVPPVGMGGPGMKKGGKVDNDMAQDKKLIKKAFGMHDKQEHKGKHTDLSKLKKGGMMKKMAKGVETMGPRTMSEDIEKGSNKLTKFGESAVQKRGHTKGKNLGDSGPTKMCGGGMKKMAKGGSASKRADGIASKGKTKGKWC